MSEWIELVHGLADGCLEGQDLEQARQLVTENPQANAEYQWALYLKERLPEACRPISDPQQWAACQARLKAIDRASRTDAFVGKYAWAMCLGVAIVIGFAGIQTRIHGAQQLSGTQMSGLLGSFRPIIEGRSADQEPQRLMHDAFADAPALAIPTGMAIRQFDRGIYDGRGAARLVLEDGLGTVSVMVIENVTGIEGISGYQDGTYVGGYLNQVPCVATHRGRFSILVVGQRPLSSLADLAHVLNRD